MTATDELRAELTKRGVEWEDMSARFPTGMLWCTSWTSQDGEPCTALEGADDIPDGKLSVQALLTPAQAIAATLGSEDTYTRDDVESAFVSGYSLGLDMFDNSKPDNEKGWDQNERNLDEEMEDLGWVRKDAATLGAGTCRKVYLLMATDIGNGREEVLGAYTTESAATKAISENQFGYAFHHVRKLEVTS